MSENKKIYCFGSGNMFIKFLEINPTLRIEGIVDNYPKGKKFISSDGSDIPVFDYTEFEPNEDCKLIITSIYFPEIIKQLNENHKYSNVEITVPDFIKEKVGFSNIQSLVNDKAADSEKCGKYLIYEYILDSKVAGGKAETDIKDILSRNGYKTLMAHQTDECIKDDTKWKWDRSKEDYKFIYNRIEDNSIIVLQHPFQFSDPAREECIRSLKEDKNVKCISIVHDVEMIRDIYLTPERKHEFEFMTEIADAFIVHNSIMKNYFIDFGIPGDRIVELGLFDYLCDSSFSLPESLKEYENVVVYAGNLHVNKSGFLSHIHELDEVNFSLYGTNYDKDRVTGKNITYNGAYWPNELPSKLNRGFGLVWDGDSLDSCEGNTGKYLKYNNPHKLSLYLASGLPVIIWNEAACASFVRNNNVGILVHSLSELPNIMKKIDKKTYNDLAANVRCISKELRDGVYTTKAISKAENILKGI